MAAGKPLPLKSSLSPQPVSLNGNRLPVKNKPKKKNPWQTLLENKTSKEECSRSNTRELKVIQVRHQVVNIDPDPVPKLSDDEETVLDEICQRIQNLPDLVIAEIMKYQRWAEGKKPVRRKINGEFKTAIALQSLVLQNEQTNPLYPSFILFLKRYFRSEYYGSKTQITMTKRCIEIMAWMYQFDRHFFGYRQNEPYNR